MKTSNVYALIVPIIIMLIIGIITRRKKMISPQGIADIKAIIINFFLPAIIFAAFYKAEYNSKMVVLTVVIFAVCVAFVLIGFLFKKILKLNMVTMPFLSTGFEAAMLGYSLFALLFGSENLGYFAATDFGHELFIFSVLFTYLRIKSNPGYNVQTAIKNVLTTPAILAMIAGIIVGTTGLGQAMNMTEIGVTIGSVISFMSAPVAALILIVIGFEIEMSRSILKPAFQTIGLRAVWVLALSLLAYYILNALIPMNEYMKWALVVFFILPPPFVIPILYQKEEEQRYIATTLSLYTLFSIVAFTVLAFLVV